MSSKIDGVPRELLERLQSQTELSNDWDEVQALLAAPVVERQEPVVIDLDAVDWETIQQAADESNWMPNEYMRNEWVADVCNFLKYGRADASPPASVSAVLPEPFAWYTEDYLTDKSATTYDVGVSVMWAVKGWPVTPLYASPPAPVAADEARAFAKGFNTLETVDGKYKIVMQFAGHDDAWEAYTALSKMTACLDKVKELNQ